QEQDRAEGDQWSERIERAVHAVEGGQAGETEECRGAAPVASQGKSVLRRREAAVGGIEIACGRRLPRGPPGYTDRYQKDDAENAKRYAHVSGSPRKCRSACATPVHRAFHWRAARRGSPVPGDHVIEGNQYKAEIDRTDNLHAHQTLRET